MFSLKQECCGKFSIQASCGCQRLSLYWGHHNGLNVVVLGLSPSYQGVPAPSPVMPGSGRQNNPATDVDQDLVSSFVSNPQGLIARLKSYPQDQLDYR